MKRLVILGAGESGVGTALLGKEKGYEVFVSDKGKIKENYKQVLIHNDIDWEESNHSEAKILNADLIMKSPGIPDKAPLVKQIREKGIPVVSEIEFASNFTEATIIGITGSNGKTTTATLTHHILKQELNVGLAGNIGDSFAKQVLEEGFSNYVLEISSFQLDDIKTFRPNIAVLLNITPDHLDRYDYQFENYVQAKFKITENQIDTDCFVINQDDTAINEYLLNHTTKAKQLFFTMNNTTNNQEGAMIKGEHMIIDINQDPFELSINELSLRGKHNQYNSMAAGISAKVAGIRKEKIILIDGRSQVI